MPIKKTKKQVLVELVERNTIHPPVHPKDPDFTYINSTSKIDWICENSHEFSAVIKNILNGSGCRKCSTKNQVPIDEIISRLNERNFKYPDKKVKIKNIRSYNGIKNHMTFVCEQGHEWSSVVSTVLNGTYCSICANTTNGKNQTYSIDRIRSIIEQHNIDFPEKHVDISDAAGYENKSTPIVLKCVKGHTWTAKIDNVIGKHAGCPVCAKSGYSLKAINWLETIMLDDGIEIQHAMNGGEYRIEGTRYLVDGYCKSTNTVYEFHGDLFHGNPDVFIASDYNPLCKKTYGELYEQTIKKETLLRDLGYKVCVIWEKEYDNIQKYKRYEGQIVNFLSSLGCTVEVDNIGIHVEGLDVIIKLCGVQTNTIDKVKRIKYHADMLDSVTLTDKRLMLMFSDEWRYDKTKVKDTLRYLVKKAVRGDPGRKCTLSEIPWKVAKQFLDEYHLLNAGSPNSNNIGAMDSGGRLVAVMTFGKPSNEQGSTDSYEMTRFVTDKKTHPGLASKMFKWAVSKYKFTEVTAFVDRRWFTGGFKFINGFTVIDKTKPSIWYTDGDKRFHRRFITKRQLVKDYNISPKLSKSSALFSIGFKTIYDCGKLKLRWRSPNK